MLRKHADGKRPEWKRAKGILVGLAEFPDVIDQQGFIPSSQRYREEERPSRGVAASISGHRSPCVVESRWHATLCLLYAGFWSRREGNYLKFTAVTFPSSARVINSKPDADSEIRLPAG